MVDEHTSDYIVGEIKTIFFENKENYYMVMQVTVDETNTLYSEKEIVVTGSFVSIQEGTTYKFNGSIVDHPKYGVQFKVRSYEALQISSKDGLIRFLSSDNFPGIGQTLAQRIVDHIDGNVIETILNEPAVLKEVKGLSAKKRTMLHELLKEQQGNQHVFIKLAEMGFSNNFASRIFAKYQNEAIEIIEENPYALIEDIRGFGFQKADQLAMKIGFQFDSDVRVKGALLYSLNEICFSAGNTYVTEDELVKATWNVLVSSQRQQVEPSLIESYLTEMAESGSLIVEAQRVALPNLFYAEAGIAAKIKHMQFERYQPQYPGVNLDEEIEKMEKELNISYGAAQKVAVKEAISSKVFILTGGPGTGKTTVLNGIVHIYAKLNDVSLNLDDYSDKTFPISLAAPTGRAAKRMGETTHLPASTIHRLLGLTGEEADEDYDPSSFSLETDLLIIDEMSMVDTFLAYRLLESIPPYMQVIFVGDRDQLPSVGPGQVLADLLRSQTVNSRELDEIFRQDENSTITTLAHDIKNGVVSSELTINKSDRSFFELSANQIPQVIGTIVARAVAKGYDKRDIQVLSPMYKGAAGIDRLNQVLQITLNPNADGKRREVSYFDNLFRVGDKVLQLKNQAEQNIFNGDIGEIVAIFFANETSSKVDEIVVAFDEIEITYERNDWNQITLAYCISIHKSQGSEFPIVLIPLVRQHNRMLQRNLLYTAITRAKQSLILIGEAAAFGMAIQHKNDNRLTQLYDFLLEAYKTGDVFDEAEGVTKKGDKDVVESTVDQTLDMVSNIVTENAAVATILTPPLIVAGKIDPMVGMSDLTPYDF